MASTTHWDADRMLQIYILDYMKRRGMDRTAEIFKRESNVGDASGVFESQEGFLHEWWCLFYETYASRNQKHQDIGPQEASSNVALQKTNGGRRNLPPRIPQPSNQRPQLLQIEATINNGMEQPAASVLPPSTPEVYEREGLGCLAEDSNPSLQLMNAKRLRLQDSGIGIQLGRDIPTDTLPKLQRRIWPSTGPQETRVNGGLNMAPLDGHSLNVLTSFLEATNIQRQFQRLDTRIQQEFACTRRSEIDIFLENSSIWNSQDPRIPLVETDLCKDRQDCMNAADGRPVDRTIVPLSDENEDAGQRAGTFGNVKLNVETCDRKKGFSFEEVGCLHSSKNKVSACHFSSDGKVLVSAGHEKKVFIWNMDTFNCASTSDTHSLLITDVRFRPGSTIFATSSADKTVKIWDATKTTKSLFKLPGHAEQVMSLDFHPRKVDLLCSCDSNGIMRLWNVNQGVCVRINKGGSKQVRFQPQIANFLAAAAGNTVNVIDIQDDRLIYKLKGHVQDVISICWDVTGNYLASVSEDSVRVWHVMSDGRCIQVLHSNGNKFRSCIFHPVYNNLLIIGCNQTLEFWIPTEGRKIGTHLAHREAIAGLGASPENQMVASASHDHTVKIWK